MHYSDACSHVKANSKSNCPLTAMALTCSYEILHRCTRHAPFSAYMPTIKSETSGLYLTVLNLETERLRTAISSSGQQRPRQVMTLFDYEHEDGNSNIHDNAPEEDHGENSCYCQARTGTGY
jgi:hypothetical protein